MLAVSEPDQPSETKGNDASNATLFKNTRDDRPAGVGRLAMLGGALVLAIGAIVYLSKKVGDGGAEGLPAVTQKKPPPKPDDVAPGATAKIAGGTFTMGGDGGDADEKPAHEVKVKDFEMDLTEVRVSDYKKCIDAGKCTAPNKGQYCNYDLPGHEAHPINCIDWDQAAAYCAFVGKRLPTEEEWEYAARPDGRKWVWKEGEPKDQLCWNGEGNDQGKGERQGTCVVASYPAGKSANGLYDLAGNVFEWTADAYCPYEKKDCESEYRVIRGGAWNNLVSSYVRAQDRAKQKKTDRVDNVGVRCAR